MKQIMNSSKLRRSDSNERPLGYEPNELPLLHSAIFCGCKSTILIGTCKYFSVIFKTNLLIGSDSSVYFIATPIKLPIP